MGARLLAALLLLAGCAPAPVPGSVAVFRPGLERFLNDPPAWTAGRRIGLITNAAGVDRAGASNIDLIAARPDLTLVALLAFERNGRAMRRTSGRSASRTSSIGKERASPIDSGVPGGKHCRFVETDRVSTSTLADPYRSCSAC